MKYGLTEQEAITIARLLDDPQLEQKGFDQFRNIAYGIDGKLKFTTNEQKRQLEELARKVNQYARDMAVQIAPAGWLGTSRAIMATPKAFVR